MSKKIGTNQQVMEFLSEHELPIRKDFLHEVVKVLAARRRELGMTQETLNRRLGMADRLLNKWECGLKSPTGFNLYCWAQALGYKLKVVPEDGGQKQKKRR